MSGDELDDVVEHDAFWAGHLAGNVQGMMFGGAVVASAGLAFGRDAVLVAALLFVGLFLVVRARRGMYEDWTVTAALLGALPACGVIVSVLVALWLT